MVDGSITASGPSGKFAGSMEETSGLAVVELLELAELSALSRASDPHAARMNAAPRPVVDRARILRREMVLWGMHQGTVGLVPEISAVTDSDRRFRFTSVAPPTDEPEICASNGK